MAIAEARIFTWHDIQALPEDGLRRELIGGQLLVAPAPGLAHQRALGRLFRLIEDACSPTHEVTLAPFDLYISEETYFQPDIMVIPRCSEAPQRFDGTPLLVVEVLSRSTRTTDLVTKRDAYARAGIVHYWIVDPEAPSVAALALEGTTYVERVSARGDGLCPIREPVVVDIVPHTLTG